jgi:hypothetical protein
LVSYPHRRLAQSGANLPSQHLAQAGSGLDSPEDGVVILGIDLPELHERAGGNGISNQRSRQLARDRDSVPRAVIQRWLPYRPWPGTVGRMK